MSSILGLSQPANVNTEAAAPPHSKSKRFSAALLSGLVPGTGQFLLGHVQSGALFLAAFAATLALFWPLRLPQWYLAFCVSVLLLGAVSVAAAWHATRCAHEKLPKLSAPWLLLVLPLAYLGSNFDANRVMRLAGFQVFNIPSSAMASMLSPTR